ncbi:alpha/beta hydrolase [Gordonia sp. CPCC 205333]|uniref:alpha/beta hydrolase n=1 Tax=Gordonia sp. CPCC 205333 TaxID=3140790 RepID=UPI003AF38E1D
MATFVLVPGSFEGSWTFAELERELADRGHSTVTLTLPGLESDFDIDREIPPNLDDHISAVVDAIPEGADLILAAHSYGGMTLPGVYERLPDRFAGVVFIDAFLPGQGDSCWTLLTDALRETFVSQISADGRYLRPLPGSDHRSSDHPVASLMQPSRVGSTFSGARKIYLFANQWAGSPFRGTFAALEKSAEWETYELTADHGLIRNQAELVAEVLDQLTAAVVG